MSYFLPPADYLPHDAPMLWLEQVLSITEDSASCGVILAPDGILKPFLDADGNLPGWYALELMAQTIGVWSGWHRRQRGEQNITLGMVLGARELSCPAGSLPAGAALTIHVNMLMQDERFASFECVINAGTRALATSRVNIFQPAPDEITALFNRGATT